MSEKVRPRDLIFGILIAIGIFAGFSNANTVMFDDYGITSDNRTIDNVTGYEDFKVFSDSLKERTEIKVTGIDPLDNFIVGTFSAVDFLFDIPDKIATWLNQVGYLLGAPDELLGIIGLVISLIVVFTIIEAITKGET